LEEGSFLQKPIELAQSSQHSIESLWKIGADVSKLYASLTLILSSFFSILAIAINQERHLEQTENGSDLTNSAFLFSNNTSSKEAKLAGETPKAIDAKLSIPHFMLNLIVSRKLPSSLESQLSKGRIKPGFSSNTAFPEATDINIGAKRLKTEEAVQDNPLYHALELGGKFQSKVAPSLAIMVSAIKVYAQQANNQLGPIAAKHKPARIEPTCNEDRSSNFQEFLKNNILSESLPLQSAERLKEAATRNYVFPTNFSTNVFGTFRHAQVLPSLIYGQQFVQSIKTGHSSVVSGISPISSSSSASSLLSSTLPQPSLSSSASIIHKTSLYPSAKGQYGKIPVPNFIFDINFNPQTIDVCSYARGLPTFFSQQQSLRTTNVLSGLITRNLPKFSLATYLSNINAAQFTEANLEQLVFQNKKDSLPRQNPWKEKTEYETSEEPDPQHVPKFTQSSSTVKQASSLSIFSAKSEEEFLRRNGVSLFSVLIAASMAKLLFFNTIVQPMLSSRRFMTAVGNEVSFQNFASTEHVPLVNSEEFEDGYLSLNPFATKLSTRLNNQFVETQRNLNKVFEGIRDRASSLYINYYHPSLNLFVESNLVANEFPKTERDAANSENSVNEPNDISLSKFTKPSIQSTLPNIGAVTLFQEIEHYRNVAVATAQVKKAVDQQFRQSLHPLPKILAITGVGNLIAKKLKHELEAFTKEEVAISTYGEAMAELNNFESARTTTLARSGASFASSTSTEPYISRAPLVTRSSHRPIFASPTIQDTINLTVSTDSSEDLRDLERKISRILSEQISRYYGSSRI
jgi:hypothetical protein